MSRAGALALLGSPVFQGSLTASILSAILQAPVVPQVFPEGLAVPSAALDFEGYPGEEAVIVLLGVQLSSLHIACFFLGLFFPYILQLLAAVQGVFRALIRVLWRVSYQLDITLVQVQRPRFLP